MYAPMLTPFIGLVIGILAGMSGAGIGVFAIAALCASGVWLLTIRASRDPVKGFARNGYHFVWIFLAFLSVGVLTYDINRPWQTDGDLSRFYAADGSIRSLTQSTTGDRAVIEVRRLIMADGNAMPAVNLKIRLYSDAIGARVDDDVIIPLHLEPIEDSPDIFSKGYASAMRSKGICYSTRCAGNEISVYGHTSTFTGMALDLRDQIEGFIEKTSLDRATINFLITILLGDRAFLDRETRELFADAGVSHILAMSGMHVAIISGIILWLLFPVNFFGHYRLRLLLSVVILLLYAFVTGWQPSTVRATLMMAAMAVAVCLERKNSAWNSLILATFVILLFNPLSLLDVGLQLSFLCVASLIFLVNPLNPIDHHDHPVLYRVCSVMLTAVAATSGTWCVSASYFGTFPLVFLPANILVLPLLPFYLVVAIFFFVLGACGLPLSPVAWILDEGHGLLIGLVRWLTDGGGSAVRFSPTAMTVVLWLLFAAMLAVYLNGDRKRWKIVACSLLGVSFVVSAAFQSNQAEADGFIVRSGLSPVTIATRVGGTEGTVVFRPASTTLCDITGEGISSRVAVIDENPDSITVSRLKDCDIIVVASGYRGDLENLSRGLSREGRLVIHQSVRRAREVILMHKADSLGIECHSIRRDGPLRVIARKP